MKKKKIIFPLLLLLVLILSGCQSGKINSQNNSEEAVQNNQKNGGDLNSGPRRPDFGQPDRDADTRGIVKSIVGNEVSVYEIASGFGRNQASSSQENVKTEDSSKPAVSLTGSNVPSGPGGGMGPGMGAGMGPGGGGERTETDRSAMLENLKAMSTGEAKIIIPVGIQMLKSSESSEDGRRDFVEASLSDISANKTLTIWLDSSVSDKKVAEFVLIN